MNPPYRVERLDASHDRTLFACRVEPLETYFRKGVGQDVRRRLTSCFVLVDVQDRSVAGYYTLASSSIALSDLPEALRTKLPRYPLIPAIRLGRLALADAHRGKGLGSALLFDAVERVLRSEIAAHALVVDAKDATAAAFYRHHGFIALSDDARVLYLPLGEAIRKLSRD